MTRRLSLLVLLLIGVALRLAFLSQPMRLDETANYMLLASRSLATCMSVYLEANNHPLHTVLVHFATTLLGRDAWCIRVPSFLAGVLLVPATYLTFRELFDRTTALLAAALVVASAPLVEYATNARGYSVQALLFVLLVFAAAKVLRTGARAWWGAFVVASVLGFYTIPTMLYFFSSVILWMLLSAVRGDASSRAKPFLARLVGACSLVSALVVLLYAPFIEKSGVASLTSNRWVQALSWSDFRAGFGEATRGYAASWHGGLPPTVALVLVVGFVASIVAFRRISPFRVNPAVVTFACCASMMLAQRVLPPARVWLPWVPLYLGSSAAGLRWLAGLVVARARIAELGATITAPVTLLVGGGLATWVLASGAPYQTADQVTFSDAETITQVLAGILKDDDIVYVQGDAYYVLAYYFELHGVPTRYIYRKGKPFASVGRAFAIDSSKEYPKFTYQLAMSDSNLARSKEYEMAVIAELPHSTVYDVLDPELAQPPTMAPPRLPTP